MQELINCYFEKNKYYYSEIRNIYFDNINEDIINSCYEYNNYRFKYRIRSYNEIINDDDIIFLELKTKLNAISYKRRAILTNIEYKNYINLNVFPSKDIQIMKEIDYVIKSKKLHPNIYIAYDRFSYFCKENQNFRLTFDFNLRYRFNDLELKDSDNDKTYFKNNYYIMEIKTDSALPIWFCDYLTSHKLYSESFSKIKKIYEKEKGKNKCLIVY